MSDIHGNTLSESLERLLKEAGSSGAAQFLVEHREEIVADLQQSVVADVPAFGKSRNPDVLPEAASHAVEHVDELLRLITGGTVGAFPFVLSHAERRAEQHFPLEVTLHAYRCGHKVFTRWFHTAAIQTAEEATATERVVTCISEFSIDYTDAISTLFTRGYIAHVKLMADVAGDQRSRLLTLLLDGFDEADRRVADTLRSAGYLDSRQSFCVVLAQSQDPSEMTNPERARRLAESVDALFEKSPFKRLIDVRDHRVVMVLSGIKRTSGWTAPRQGLSVRVLDTLRQLGPAVRTGVSNEVTATAHIPYAFQQATHALAFANVQERVVGFANLPLSRVLLHLTGPELQRLLPQWAHSLRAADNRANGSLGDTLRAYADADMNALKAAKALSIHSNTIYARFERITEATDRDPRRYHALSELLLVCEAMAGDKYD